MGYDAEVTPNALWPKATSGWVKLHGEPHGILPIVVIRVCPATVKVQREQYPTGVVIFNDYPLPHNAIPKELDVLVFAQDEKDVDIQGIGNEPYGVVVLFK